MTFKPRHFVLALACMSPLLAVAEWIDVGTTDEKQNVQLDSERFKRQGDAVTAVLRIQLPAPRRVPFSPNSYVSAERIYHFQCADKKFITASGKMLDKGGAVVYEFDSAKNPFGVPKPQSVPKTGEDAVAFAGACKYKE